MQNCGVWPLRKPALLTRRLLPVALHFLNDNCLVAVGVYIVADADANDQKLVSLRDADPVAGGNEIGLDAGILILG